MRILFVDDEPHLLDGLRDRLRRRRREWNMAFAVGAEAALAQLRADPFDIIVSDIRMPGMDGLTLLRRVQQQYPSMVRIVLSGSAELDLALRSLPIAHQYLSKPIEAESLEGAIERTARVHALLGETELRNLIGSLEGLPSLPHIYVALTQALQDPGVSIEVIAKLIEQDVAMSAELLRLANSAFFTKGQRIGGIRGAVKYLGTTMIKNLALSIEVFRSFAPASEAARFSFEALQRHSLATAEIAGKLLPSPAHAEEAVVAAMLHDVGQLILATRLPGEFAKARALAKEQGRPLHAVERELHGITHAEMGAYLLGLWGFTYPVVEAVAYHHAPVPTGEPGLDVVGAVHIADFLGHEQAACGPKGGTDGPDAAYLESSGIADRLPGWRVMAAELAAARA